MGAPRTASVSTESQLIPTGADLDMADCHPGDLDPHAVSGTLKSYLRERKLTTVVPGRNEVNCRADVQCHSRS
jgi:hypothetical protein